MNFKADAQLARGNYAGQREIRMEKADCALVERWREPQIPLRAATNDNRGGIHRSHSRLALHG
jgi:hypothetical protein